MAELIVKLEELRHLPIGQHWFCPSRDLVVDPDEDEGPLASVVKDENSSKEEVAHRAKLVTDSLQLFGFDGEEAIPHQEYLRDQIERQLGKCDLCVVQYYKARLDAMESLRGDYEEDDVSSLGKLFDDRDIDRIKRGLEVLVQTLRAVAPKQRGKDILKISSQMALFEALSSRAFLADSNLVENYLDEPFKLIQTNKRLRLARYVPAATVFLFDSSQEKCLWAMQAWSKLPSPITKGDFDFAVREPLLQNLKAASEPITDLSFNQRLWYGIRQIVDKLDNELITHSVRAMEVDLFRITLEHLQYKTPALRFLMQTMQKLLEVAPKDYWDSMGAISPTTVIEQVFNNPQYDQFMLEARPDEEFDNSALKDMLSWIKPFLASLQIGHQAQACRSLTFQLIDRLQADRFPAYARIECYRAGLDVLIWALDSCNQNVVVSNPVGRIVAIECLEVTGTYLSRILDMPKFTRESDYPASLVASCLTTVKEALALSCKTLKTDQENLRRNKSTPSGLSPYSEGLWISVVNHLNRRNSILAGATLTGITDFTSLENFRTSQDDPNSHAKKAFNESLKLTTKQVCAILQQLNDFNPDDLDELYQNSNTSAVLFATLFSWDDDTHVAAVNLIKSISSESGRWEAIRHLLLSFFGTTLTSLSGSIRGITRNRSYAFCPGMMKICGDTVTALGNHETGVLRTRPLTNSSEVDALEDFWEQQWQALKVIYEMTEEWGKAKVENTQVMRDFCRNTMEYSDRLFDQYSLYANAIDSAVSNKEVEEGKSLNHKVGKKLLRLPAAAMEAMVQWLKLRDVQLAAVAVQLTKKVLNRLTEWDMKVDDAPRESLERIVHNGPQGRTHLTPQEKAELARALEANLGYSISPPDTDHEQPTRDSAETSTKAKKTKPGIIDLQAWRAKAKVPLDVVDISGDEEFGDSDILDQDILSASRSVELLKEQQSSRSSSRDAVHVGSARITLLRPDKRTIKSAKIINQQRADQISFREKREKERAAKKKRDAEELAIVKKRIANKDSKERSIGEGAVLGQIGLKGKDHAPKIASLMVSSDSESDSDEQLDQDIFGGSKASKVSDAVREYQSSRMKQAREPQPIKKTKQARSAKDMRARLAPDLVSLHQTILGWDFFHSGDFPPGSDRQDYSLVTNVFRHPKDYQNTFEPLLVLEAWQGFLKSKEEGNFKPFEIRVVNRCTVDSFIEVSTSIEVADAKTFSISEADVVLLSKAPSPTTDASQPHCFARVFKIKRLFKRIDVAYRINVGNSLISSFVPNATLFGAKIQSLTPLEREYGALLGLQYFDLCDEIIRAKPSPLLQYSANQIAPFMANYTINYAQAKAVKSALDNDGFTLIQGPPGSGKTKTIVALVGALLTSTFSDKGISIARPRVSSPQQTGSKKMLVCAPSNAAVDELVMRFKEGIKTADGRHQDLKVVRLGRSDAINANVLDVTLEELVNELLNRAAKKKSSSGEDIQTIMMRHKATCEELNTLRATIDIVRASGKSVTSEQERSFDLLKRKKQQLSNEIDAARDTGEIVARSLEMARRKAQQDVLSDANVICATLSGSGHDMFQHLDIEFETVIIDEAAQSIELSALIPLKYGCSKCILVGDPKQLPPTVLSREAARFQYEQSLFVRMQANHQKDVHLLDTQYRMHPEISLFPSKSFYDGKLLDGENMAVIRAKPWHQSEILGAYRFFDVQGTQQSAPRGHSLINIAEIEVALRLYQRLTTDCKGYDFKGKVGIITPYKSQLRELRLRFAGQYGDSILSRVEFNTTDAFQGRESEVIIFSCVRASVTKGIGFLSDIRRMNVGITRAKSSLWVLGNSQSLMKGEFWGRLIQDAKSRDRYTGGDLIEMLEKPLLDLEVESTTKAGKSSLSATLKTNQDVQMQDAPVSGTIKSVNSRSSSTKNSPIDKAMEDAWGNNPVQKDNTQNQKNQPLTARRYMPSGGANGLNSNLNCAKCGSSAHRTHECDNEEAKGLSTDRCYRCGDSNHRSLQCSAKRCLDCGAFGHLKETCTSTNMLSREAKHNIWKQETAHRQTLIRAPEIQRRRQLGDHAKETPKLRVTSESPPPQPKVQTTQVQQTASGKRKRQPSPPTYMPNKRISQSKDAKLASQIPLDNPSRKAAEDDKSKGGLLNPKAPGKAQTGNPLASGISEQTNGNKTDATIPNANAPEKLTPVPPPTKTRPPIRRKKEVSMFIKPKPRR